MTTLIIVGVTVVALLLYTALINGVFKRCPHCGKLGSGCYDKVGSPVEEKDEAGLLVSSTQKLQCRSCQKFVTEVWSDFDGRTFLKKEDILTNETQSKIEKVKRSSLNRRHSKR